MNNPIQSLFDNSCRFSDPLSSEKIPKKKKNAVPLKKGKMKYGLLSCGRIEWKIEI